MTCKRRGFGPSFNYYHTWSRLVGDKISKKIECLRHKMFVGPRSSDGKPPRGAAGLASRPTGAGADTKNGRRVGPQGFKRGPHVLEPLTVCTRQAFFQ